MDKPDSSAPAKEREAYTICVLGGGAVGKSSLICRYLYDEYEDKEAPDPTLQDEYTALVNVAGNDYLLTFIDTAGQEQYQEHRKEAIGCAHGFLMVYDVTQRSSFEEVESFVNEVCRVKGRDTRDMAILIVGNKCDAPGRQVPKEEASKFALDSNCAFMEVSASTSKYIKESLAHMLGELTVKRKEGWLWKVPDNASTVTKWERKWALLTQEELKFFKNKEASMKKKPGSVVELKLVEDVLKDEEDLTKTENAFLLVTPSQTFALHTAQPFERDDWVNTLIRLVNKKRDKKEIEQQREELRKDTKKKKRLSLGELQRIRAMESRARPATIDLGDARFDGDKITSPSSARETKKSDKMEKKLEKEKKDKEKKDKKESKKKEKKKNTEDSKKKKKGGSMIERANKKEGEEKTKEQNAKDKENTGKEKNEKDKKKDEKAKSKEKSTNAKSRSESSPLKNGDKERDKKDKERVKAKEREREKDKTKGKEKDKGSKVTEKEKSKSKENDKGKEEKDKDKGRGKDKNKDTKEKEKDSKPKEKESKEKEQDNKGKDQDKDRKDKREIKDKEKEREPKEKEKDKEKERSKEKEAKGEDKTKNKEENGKSSSSETRHEEKSGEKESPPSKDKDKDNKDGQRRGSHRRSSNSGSSSSSSSNHGGHVRRRSTHSTTSSPHGKRRDSTTNSSNEGGESKESHSNSSNSNSNSRRGSHTRNKMHGSDDSINTRTPKPDPSYKPPPSVMEQSAPELPVVAGRKRK